MSGRFMFREPPDLPGTIEKRGDPAALAREAAALGRLAGRPWAPALVEEGPGRIVSERLPGAPLAASAIGPSGARRLGAVLAELHALPGAAAGGLWWWDAPATAPADYRDRRAADAEAALAGTPASGLAARAAAAATAAPEGPDAFRMLHGDLVAANVVWGPAGPGLVDWEFWRMGDPAEDLGYLIGVNDLGDAATGALLAGYGDRATASRAVSWAPLAAADAAGWYLARGMEAEAAAMLASARRRLGD